MRNRASFPTHKVANIIVNKGSLLEAWRCPSVNTDQEGQGDKTIDALTRAVYDYAIAGPLVACSRAATRLDVEMKNGSNS